MVRANSGEMVEELKARIGLGNPIDHAKPDPTLVTPAADHWMNDLNQSLGRSAVSMDGIQVVASTFIGIVTSREMALCLGWPENEIGFADIARLSTDPLGWTAYPCARPEWGREALLAYTYPTRSSTARSVLFALYSIAAGKPAEQLTEQDVARPEVASFVKRFQNAIDCYVPDTLDLNTKILAAPGCAHFYFIAEDNLVKLYQGKLEVLVGDRRVPTHLDRDLVMIYPKEGAIIHNHSAFVVEADFVPSGEAEAAAKWISYLRQPRQQQAFMQQGFRPTTGIACVNPLGSPFSQCTSQPKVVIYPDRVPPIAVFAILKAWE